MAAENKYSLSSKQPAVSQTAAASSVSKKSMSIADNRTTSIVQKKQDDDGLQTCTAKNKLCRFDDSPLDVNKIARSVMQLKAKMNGDQRLENEPAATGEKEISTGSVIQRQVIVHEDAFGNIITVVVDRDFMASLFNGQGDHMSAFTVFRAMFVNRLMGLTLHAALGVLDTIFAEFQNLPGYLRRMDAPVWAQVILTDEFNDVVNYRNAAHIEDAMGNLEDIDINNYASALLSFRNVIPLSAREFGGVGHGEGHWQGHIQALNTELLAGNAFNINRRNRLSEYAGHLIDHESFSHDNAFPLGHVDQDLLPGLQIAPNAAISPHGPLHNNRLLMSEQHVQTIESAYPAIRNSLALNPAARNNFLAHLHGLL